MKRIFIFLTGLIVPFLLYSQGPDETKIRGNVYITRGADTLRIQQNGSYVDFYSTDPIRFNSTVYASALNATGVTVSGASSFGSTVTGITASPGDNSTKFATTAFVTAAIAAGGGGGGGGTVTAVLKGNGMSFSDFTTSGTITLGTPSSVTASSTNIVTTNSHTHQLTVPGTTGSILINNSNSLSYDADFYYDIVHDGIVAPSGMIYDMYSDSIYIENNIRFKNILSAPTTPTDEGYAYVYQDSFRFKNEAGTVFTLGVSTTSTGLPDQSGHGGQFLATNGTSALWSNKIYTSGTAFYIDSTTSVNIRGIAGEKMAVLTANGSVELYYNNIKRLQTEVTGVAVIGNLDISSGELFASDTSYFQSLISSSAFVGMEISPSLGTVNQGNILLSYGTATNGGTINVDGGFGSSTTGGVYLGSRDDGANWTSPVYVQTQAGSDSSLLVASTEYVDQAIYGVTSGGTIPTQSGHANEFLTTNGTVTSWTATIGKDWYLHDNINLKFGTGADSYITYDGNNMVVGSYEGWQLYVDSTSMAILARPDSTVALYYAGVRSMETEPGGIKSDTVDAVKIETENISLTNALSGQIKLVDAVGSGGDLYIYGAGSSGADAGNVYMAAGTGTGVGSGGSVSIYGGDSVGVGGTYGQIILGSANLGASYRNKTYIYTETDNADSSNIAASTAFVKRLVSAGSALPSMTGKAGKIMMTDGGIALWSDTIGTNLTMNDNRELRLGTSGAEGSWYSNGSSPIFKANSTAYFLSGTSENLATFAPNGAVTLYYDNVAKLATSAGGITVTGTASVTGNVALASGSDRQIYINGVSGEDLSIFAGAHLASGTAGSVFIYGGTSLGTNGDVWLGYTDAGSTSLGYVYAQTVALGDSTKKVATTSFVDRAVASVSVLPSQSGHTGQLLTTNGTVASWTAIINQDLAMSSGTDRQVYIDGVSGENLSIFAGAHLASGTAGSVFVSGGSSLGINGDVWLAHTDAGITIRGSAYSPTVSQGDNSRKVATTAYVDRMVPSVTGNSGKYLYTNGSTTSWQVVTSSSSAIPCYPHIANEINLSNQFGISYKKSVSQYTAMSAGNNNPFASLVVGSYFYVITRTNPAILFRYSVDDFGTYTSCTFPTSTYYSSPEQMIYESSTGKIYIYFGYNSRISIVQVGTSSVTDTTTVVSYNTPAAQGSGPMISDGTYIYLASNHYSTADSLYQYRISDWSKITSIRITGNPTTYPNAMAYDGTRLFITTTSDTYTSYNKLYTATPATMTMGADSTPIYSYMTDDLVVAGDKLYIGKEDATGCIMVLDKSVSPITKDSIQTPVLSSCYGVFFDGGNIWATMAGSPGSLVKIDPYTSEVAYMTFPSGYNNTNELSIEGGRMFLTFYAAPFKLGRLTLPKMTPALYVKTSSSASTTYSLSAADNNKIIRFTSGSAITLTVPTGLPIGFSCMVMQGGAGKATFTASGTTISNRNGYTKTAGQYAVASIVSISSNTFVTSGDMQ